jgi:AbrB family looped-hinge helix DNA binding protein
MYAHIGLRVEERMYILHMSYSGMHMAATGLTTTVSTKGQVILPKAIRDLLHWDVGTRLAVEQTADGVLLKPLTTEFAPTRPEDVFGSLHYQGEPKSIEQMDSGITDEVRRRHARGRY